MFHVLQYRIHQNSVLSAVAPEFGLIDLDIVVSYVSEEVCPTVPLKQFILKFLLLMITTNISNEGLVEIENYPVCFLTAALRTAFNYEAPIWVSGFTEFSFYILPSVTSNTEVWIVLQ